VKAFIYLLTLWVAVTFLFPVIAAAFLAIIIGFLKVI